MKKSFIIKKKKSFNKGWNQFKTDFPNAPKVGNALTNGLQEILEVNTMTSIRNYRDGKFPISEYTIRRIEQLFLSLNITDPWDDSNDTAMS